ncbi:MAG: hypothetical protein Q9195_001223 [Heterodermia aff. obscurata]
MGDDLQITARRVEWLETDLAYFQNEIRLIKELVESGDYYCDVESVMGKGGVRDQVEAAAKLFREYKFEKRDECFLRADAEIEKGKKMWRDKIMALWVDNMTGSTRELTAELAKFTR